MKYSWLKTIGKAAKATGIFVGSAALVGAGIALQDTTVLTVIWSTTGPVALIAVPALSFAGAALADWIKHRNQ